MNGAECLVQSLQDLGVRRIYGYTGGSILPVYAALGKAGISIIVNSNEQACAFSAAGHSRSTDEVGVAIVTSGPAITNALTAVADSYADSIPLIVIAGQVPEHKIGTDAFQHINVREVFREASKAVIEVKNGDLERIIKDAHFLAKEGKPGPVVIDFPLNAQLKEIPYANLDAADFRSTYENGNHLSDGQCHDFFALLHRSKRPLLYIGGGASSAELRAFNERYRIPFTHTLMAHGVMDGRDPLSLGMLGMFGTPYANMAIQKCDFFFALGVRWDDRVADKVGEFGPHAEIAYIDINPEKVKQIRAERKPAFSFIGDTKIALADLLKWSTEKCCAQATDIDDWRDETMELRRTWPLDHRRDGPIQEAQVMEQLSTMIDDRTIVTTGVGNHQMLAAQYLRMQRPKTFITSGSFGTMGFALPAAIGAQYAHPEERVIAIDGDGSIKMNMGELATIGRLRLPIKILLLNNNCDGMVRNLQDVAYGGNHVGTERDPIDFCGIARGCGIMSAMIEDPADIPSALGDLVACEGPRLLEVRCDPDEAVYPRVPAGKGYQEMVLGPYIKKRA